MKEKEYLILVDEKDRAWGKLEKMEVHELGLLHRAFSVFLFNSNGELLMQQRADEKYHSAGLWTNTCCSHPNYGETLDDAIERRLPEEMGISALVYPVFNFVYKAEFDNGLTEHEFDHIYVGVSNQIPKPDPSEVKAWKYMEIDFLLKDIRQNPDRYTAWFRLCLPKLVDHLMNELTLTNGEFHPDQSYHIV